MEEKKLEITISEELYKKLEDSLKDSGANSVNELIAMIITEVMAEEEKAGVPEFSADEEEEIKERLRSLGYID